VSKVADGTKTLECSNLATNGLEYVFVTFLFFEKKIVAFFWRFFLKLFFIYIIIWLSLLLLSVHSLSPPKPVGLDPNFFCRRTLYYMRKSLGIKVLGFLEKTIELFFLVFFGLFFCENAERSVA
jgi:hypothetical protein